MQRKNNSSEDWTQPNFISHLCVQSKEMKQKHCQKCIAQRVFLSENVWTHVPEVWKYIFWYYLHISCIWCTSWDKGSLKPALFIVFSGRFVVEWHNMLPLGIRDQLWPCSISPRSQLSCCNCWPLILGMIKVFRIQSHNSFPCWKHMFVDLLDSTLRASTLMNLITYPVNSHLVERVKWSHNSCVVWQHLFTYQHLMSVFWHHFFLSLFALFFQFFLFCLIAVFNVVFW